MARKSPEQQSIAQQTESHNDEQTRSSKHVIYSTERLSSPQNPKRRPRSRPTPPHSPLLNPLPPVMQHEPTATSRMPTRSALSPRTHRAMMAKPPALPHSEPRTPAQNRWSTPPGPAEHPQNVPEPYNPPQCERKHAVLLPTTSANGEHQQLQKNGTTMALPLPAPPCSHPQPRKWPLSPATPPPSSVLTCMAPAHPCFDWADVVSWGILYLRVTQHRTRITCIVLNVVQLGKRFI
jgi:hypothetical protein